MIYAIGFIVFLLYLISVGSSSAGSLTAAGGASRGGVGAWDEADGGASDVHKMEMVFMGEREMCADLTFELH